MGSLKVKRVKLSAALLVVLAFILGHMPRPAAAAVGGKPTVVLDPDQDNTANTINDGVPYTALPFTTAIAQAVAAELPSVCDANIVVTSGSGRAAGRAARAAQM